MGDAFECDRCECVFAGEPELALEEKWGGLDGLEYDLCETCVEDIPWL